MNLSIVSKQLELTDAIKAYIQDKVGSFEKFNLDVIAVKAIVSSVDKNGKKGFAIEFILQLAGKDTVVIKQTDKDLYAAIDLAEGRAKKVLGRHHDKISSHKTHSKMSIPFVTVEEDAEDDEIVPAALDVDKPIEIDEALEIFKKAEKIDNNNFEILWRLSRTYVEIAEKMPSGTSEQEKAQLDVYQIGLEYAEKAVKKDPDNSTGYLRRAIANGRIALFKGIFSVAGVVNSVRADVEKSIQLGNGGNFVQGVAHYVLGRTHAKTSEKWKPARSVLGLGWADNDIAIEEYKKAISLYPGYTMFYVDYAISLIREDDYKTAREMLNKAFSCQKQNQDDDNRIVEAHNIMKEIANK